MYRHGFEQLTNYDYLINWLILILFHYYSMRLKSQKLMKTWELNLEYLSGVFICICVLKLSLIHSWLLLAQTNIAKLFIVHALWPQSICYKYSHKTYIGSRKALTHPYLLLWKKNKFSLKILIILICKFMLKNCSMSISFVKHFVIKYAFTILLYLLPYCHGNHVFTMCP